MSQPASETIGSGTGTPERRLVELGITLPAAPKPVAAYVPAVRSGALLFVAGQIPMREGRLLHQGRVGVEVSIEDGIACARQCAINGLAVIREALGSLDSVARVVRLGVFVACDAGFHDQPRIANGASQLMLDVFGEAGRHARAAVGTNDLPLGAPVEIEFTIEAIA
ncbi:MAG: RidA family protein [Phycisphaeraceae bacterium]|nr:RidA family protein [Phycisphaeraceae bacterium]